MTEQEKNPNQLLLGIDLGTSRTAVLSNRGYRNSIRSVIGYPRDIVSVKMLGGTEAFGREALAQKSGLCLYFPLEGGVLREGERAYQSAFELLRHVVEQARQGENASVSGVIGVTASASVSNAEALLEIADELLDTALVVSGPFLVAYYLDKLSNCIIIDLGAGTIDLCAMKGSLPGPDAQVSLLKGGDYLDERLETAISRRYPQVQLTRNLVQSLKETHAFVGAAAEPVTVSLRAQGRPARYDLTSEMRLVCESIVPEIIEGLAGLIKSFDPDDQQSALQNIYLAGGGARIRGLAEMIGAGLGEYGPVNVTPVDDPEYAGAAGALRMATELAPEDWSQVGAVGGG
jgi:rod shape-determining protein MreB